MTIGVDIDGVVAEFVEPFLRRLNGDLNTNFAREDVSCFDFDTALNLPPGTSKALISELGRSGFYRSLCPIPGVVEVLPKLEARHKVAYVTSRPDWARQDTEAWLLRNGLQARNLELNADKAGSCHWDIFVEDNGEIAQRLCAASTYVLLFDSPWNRHIIPTTDLIRVATWRGIADTVKHIEETMGSGANSCI